MPTPSGSSETKKLSGQLAQMANSISSNDKMITSNQTSPSKKVSDSKGNAGHQGGMNGNKYNAQHHKQVEQQNQIQAKKRSQQQEQK